MSRYTHLVVNERYLLCNGLSDEFEFKVEILPSEYGVVVFLDICFHTVSFSLRHTRKGIGQAGNSKLYLPNLLLLLLREIKTLVKQRNR